MSSNNLRIKEFPDMLMLCQHPERSNKRMMTVWFARRFIATRRADSCRIRTTIALLVDVVVSQRFSALTNTLTPNYPVCHSATHIWSKRVLFCHIYFGANIGKLRNLKKKWINKLYIKPNFQRCFTTAKLGNIFSKKKNWSKVK